MGASLTVNTFSFETVFAAFIGHFKGSVIDNENEGFCEYPVEERPNPNL